MIYIRLMIKAKFSTGALIVLLGTRYRESSMTVIFATYKNRLCDKIPDATAQTL